MANNRRRDLKVVGVAVVGLAAVSAVDFGVRNLLGLVVKIPVLETRLDEQGKHTSETVTAIHDSLTRLDAKLDSVTVALATRGIGIVQAAPRFSARMSRLVACLARPGVRERPDHLIPDRPDPPGKPWGRRDDRRPFFWLIGPNVVRA